MAIAFISVIANAQDITISGITLGATKNEVIKILNEKKYKYHFSENNKNIVVSYYKNILSTGIKSMLIKFNSDNILIRITLTNSPETKTVDIYDNIIIKLKEKYGEPSNALKYRNTNYLTWEVNNLYLTTSGSESERNVFVNYSDTRYKEKETTADY